MPKNYLLPFLWLANGFLACAYLLAENALALLLLAPLGWLTATAPGEQRPWTAAAAGLALLACVVAPQPVPLLLLVMAFSALIAILLERFNPAALRWRATGGMALYGLMGLGLSGYQALAPTLNADPMLSQGQAYLGVLVSVAMYLYPLGFLALLAQSIWVHPPLGSSPEGMIHSIRSRGKS